MRQDADSYLCAGVGVYPTFLYNTYWMRAENIALFKYVVKIIVVEHRLHLVILSLVLCDRRCFCCCSYAHRVCFEVIKSSLLRLSLKDAMGIQVSYDMIQQPCACTCRTSCYCCTRLLVPLPSGARKCADTGTRESVRQDPNILFCLEKDKLFRQALEVSELQLSHPKKDWRTTQKKTLLYS